MQDVAYSLAAIWALKLALSWVDSLIDEQRDDMVVWIDCLVVVIIWSSWLEADMVWWRRFLEGENCDLRWPGLWKLDIF